jgi:hypothetical protein
MVGPAAETSPAPFLLGPGPALVLRQAQDEGYFRDDSLEILILSLSKDEDFGSKVDALWVLARPEPGNAQRQGGDHEPSAVEADPGVTLPPVSQVGRRARISGHGFLPFRTRRS